MLIELSKIHGSAHPIRETWSEEKMQELTTSIRGLGVIVPIKVRPNSDGYEVIYGHRRVEAARRVGLSHIPAEVEGVSDADSIKQAMAENLVREDMVEIEKARTFEAMEVDFGMTRFEIGVFAGISEERVTKYINLVNDPLVDYVKSFSKTDLHNIGDLVNKALATKPLGDLADRARVLDTVGEKDARAVSKVSQAIRPLSKEDRHAVLDKADRERLKPEHIEQVAQALQEANREQKSYLKESVLAIRGDAPMYEDMVRQRTGMLNFIERKEEAHKKKKQNEVEDYDQLVKEGIGYIRTLYTWMVDYAYEGIEQGKFSPEAARFVLKRFGSLITEYETNLKPSLEQIKE